jgi:hypothetical protein
LWLFTFLLLFILFGFCDNSAHAEKLIASVGQFQVFQTSTNSNIADSNITVLIREKNSQRSIKIVDSAFLLHSPARLVLDISTDIKLPARVEEKKLPPFIKKIRAASYPDHIRFVFDLTSDASSIQSQKKNGKDGYLISLSLTKEKNDSQSIRTVPTPITIQKEVIQLPKPTSTPTITPTATPEQIKKITISEEPTLTPTQMTPEIVDSETIGQALERKESAKKEKDRKVIEQIAPTPTSSFAPLIDPQTGVITRVSFSSANLNKENPKALTIELTEIKNANLNKTSEEFYTLLIEKALVDDQRLLLPQFPPSTVEGMQAIQMSQSGENVEVKIFIDDGTLLEMELQANSITIKAKAQK